jgi:glycosyltransferase involved in cell wall biosynthesis
MTLRLLVEGWHAVPHSYAVVLRNQIRFWLDDPRVTLYFREAPLLPGWSARPDDLDELSTRLVRRHAFHDEPVDCVYRVAYPYDTTPRPGAERAPVALFMTSEYQTLEDGQFSTGGVEALRAACADRRILPITPSAWSAVALQRLGVGRFEVIAHGVDPAVLRPRAAPTTPRGAALRERLGTSFVLLSIGAMTQNKGVLQLLRAFMIVRRARPDIALVLKGVASLYDSRRLIDIALAAAAKSLLLSARELAAVEQAMVVLDADMTPEEIADLYTCADLYVTPYSAEGFNLPALEAVASGVPVVATAGGPTDEFLSASPSAAYLVRATTLRGAGGRTSLAINESSLVAELRRGIDERRARTPLMDAAADHVRTQFTWESATARTLDALMRLTPLGDEAHEGR